MTKNLAKVYIDGKEVLANATFQVEIVQVMGTHNLFKLNFATSSNEGYGATLMDESINHIGKKISISYQDSLEFIGLINDVQVHKANAATGIISITGYSEDVLLAQRYDCMSFEEGLTLQDVISEAIKDHKGVQQKFGYQMGVTLPYTVQYNETDFDFLYRMCARYGKWLYNNGKELCIGRIGEKTVEGIYGKELRTFGLKGSLQEQAFSVNQHDWVNNSPLEGHSSISRPEAKHPYVNTIKQNSDFLYKTEGYYNWVHGQPEYSSQQGIDQATKAHTLGKTANMLKAKGTSILYKLRLGDTLQVKGFNFTDEKKKEAYGSYLITKIKHSFGSAGNYVNEFEGVPEGTAYPSYSNAFSYPRAETQRAIVKDNADPEGLGRVKIQFPWQQKDGDRTTPWIKMATPYAGADKGFYFIPEIDEEVLVGFEGANAERPFVLSAGFNKTAKSDFATPNNNIKAIKTRSGHVIELNDTKGEESITITDKNSNIIFIDTENNNVEVYANETMKFTAKNIELNAIETIKQTAGKDFSITSTEESISIEASKSVKTKAEDVLTEANATHETKAKDILGTAKNEIDLKAKKGAKLSSKLTEVSGKQHKIKLP